MNPRDVQNNARRIITGLTVLQVFQVIGGVLLLGFFAVLSMGPGTGLLSGLFGGDPLFGASNGDFSKPLWQMFASISALSGLLSLVCIVTAVILIGWAKQWIGKLRDAAVGRAPDPRLKQLRRTFGNWIVFTQWAPLILTVLIVVSTLTFGALINNFMETFDTSSRSGSPVGQIFALSMVISVLSEGVPLIIINWLILASVRRFLDVTTDRAFGSRVAVTPAASSVGNWFVFLLVCLGLWTVISLLGVLFSVMISEIGRDTTSGNLKLPALVASVLILFPLILEFLLILWSRQFALGVAQSFDASGGPSLNVAPFQPFPSLGGVNLDKSDPGR